MKKLSKILSISVLAVALLVLGACAKADNFDARGAAVITITLDMEYPDININCVSGVITSDSATRYTIELKSKNKVDVIITATGYDTKILSFGTSALSSGTLARDVKLERSKYLVNLTVAGVSDLTAVKFEDPAGAEVPIVNLDKRKFTIALNDIAADQRVTVSAGSDYEPYSLELDKSMFFNYSVAKSVTLIAKSDTRNAFLTVINDIGAKDIENMYFYPIDPYSYGMAENSISSIQSSAGLMIDRTTNYSVSINKIIGTYKQQGYASSVVTQIESFVKASSNPYPVMRLSQVTGIGFTGVKIELPDGNDDAKINASNNIAANNRFVAVEAGDMVFVRSNWGGLIDRVITVTEDMITAGKISVESGIDDVLPAPITAKINGQHVDIDSVSVEYSTNYLTWDKIPNEASVYLNAEKTLIDRVKLWEIAGQYSCVRLVISAGDETKEWIIHQDDVMYEVDFDKTVRINFVDLSGNPLNADDVVTPETVGTRLNGYLEITMSRSDSGANPNLDLSLNFLDNYSIPLLRVYPELHYNAVSGLYELTVVMQEKLLINVTVESGSWEEYSFSVVESSQERWVYVKPSDTGLEIEIELREGDIGKKLRIHNKDGNLRRDVIIDNDMVNNGLIVQPFADDKGNNNK